MDLDMDCLSPPCKRQRSTVPWHKSTSKSQSSSSVTQPGVSTTNWKPNSISIGTECSGGTESPVLALKKVLHRLPHACRVAHRFSCEIDRACRLMIIWNHRPETLFLDVHTRPLSQMPSPGSTDVYVAGPPCQPYSRAGKNAGVLSLDGSALLRCIDAIIHLKPKIGILENVENLQSQHSQVAGEIMKRAEKACFSAHMGLLNSSDFLLPQNRPRVFFVFILKAAQRLPFKFPTSQGPTPSVEKCLAPVTSAELASRKHALPLANEGTARRNVEDSLTRLRAAGIPDPHCRPFVIDPDGTREHTSFDRSPCLTRSRAQSGFWLTNRGRRMHLSERAALQGFAVDHTTQKITGMRVPQDISTKQVGAMLGNAMSIPVLEALLVAGLQSVGMEFA